MELLIGGIGLGQLEIVTDGAAHQGVSLRHKDEVRAGSFADVVFPLGTIHRHGSFVWFDKGEHQTEERGLASACDTHQGRLAARMEIVAEMRKNLTIAIGIMEADVLEADAEGGGG